MHSAQILSVLVLSFILPGQTDKVSQTTNTWIAATKKKKKENSFFLSLLHATTDMPTNITGGRKKKKKKMGLAVTKKQEFFLFRGCLHYISESTM